VAATGPNGHDSRTAPGIPIRGIPGRAGMLAGPPWHLATACGACFPPTPGLQTIEPVDMSPSFATLLQRIRACCLCQTALPLGCRPVLQAAPGPGC
jgi:hypothetical protein